MAKPKKPPPRPLDPTRPPDAKSVDVPKPRKQQGARSPADAADTSAQQEAAPKAPAAKATARPAAKKAAAPAKKATAKPAAKKAAAPAKKATAKPAAKKAATPTKKATAKPAAKKAATPTKKATAKPAAKKAAPAKKATAKPVAKKAATPAKKATAKPAAKKAAPAKKATAKPAAKKATTPAKKATAKPAAKVTAAAAAVSLEKPAAQAAPVGAPDAASAPPTEPVPVGNWDYPPSAPKTSSPFRRPSARLWQALGFAAVAAIVAAVGIVLMLRPLMSQNDEPTDPGQPSRTIPFIPPVALPANASYVETVVLPSGDLKVTHWIRTKLPKTSIKLIAPVLAGIDSGVVTATKVEVAADEMIVPGADAVDGVSQGFQFVGAKSIYVTYVLSGALERSTSVASRALARVTALDLTYPSMSGTSLRSVQGVEVLNLACSPAGTPDAVPEPCGKPDPDGWQVQLAGGNRNDHVMAQLQLS